MALSPPAYMLNALAVDFDSIYALGDEYVTKIFQCIEKSGLRNFLGGLSLEIYPDELLNIYGNSHINDEGAVAMRIGEFDISLDEGSFAALFSLPTEGIINFTNILSTDVDDILTVSSATSIPMKPSGARKEMKVEYQLFVDIVAKSLLAKAGSFAAMTLEKFQIMTAIIKGIPINWSAVLFHIFKNMVSNTKQSFGFAIQMSKFLEDSGLPLNGSHSLHKSRMLNAQSVITLKPNLKSLNVTPAEFTALKKEIGDELMKEKQAAKRPKDVKAGKTKSSPAPKPKPKRKFVDTHSDSEATIESSQPLITKKARTTKTKPAAASGLLIIKPSKESSTAEEAKEKETTTEKAMGKDQEQQISPPRTDKRTTN